ncbi:MAG: porphobilinogen deaminase, partial [Polaromonas sp.]|nr:porphobilinogen deaminase [Polaromonas sp.]
RTVSRAMGGSCSMPLAAFVTSAGQGGAMQLEAAWGDMAEAPAPASALPRHPLVQARQSAVVASFAQAEALGEAVAAQLRAGGAVWAGNPPVA